MLLLMATAAIKCITVNWLKPANGSRGYGSYSRTNGLLPQNSKRYIKCWGAAVAVLIQCTDLSSITEQKQYTYLHPSIFFHFMVTGGWSLSQLMQVGHALDWSSVCHRVNTHICVLQSYLLHTHTHTCTWLGFLFSLFPLPLMLLFLFFSSIFCHFSSLIIYVNLTFLFKIDVYKQFP